MSERVLSETSRHLPREDGQQGEEHNLRPETFLHEVDLDLTWHNTGALPALVRDGSRRMEGTCSKPKTRIDSSAEA